MTDAERLAERLLDLVSNFTKPSYRNTLTDSAALIRSQAEELERLRGALGDATKTANLLYANAVGCAANHYGEDIHEHGLPGWLADCAKDIQAARAALGETKAAPEQEQASDWP